MKQVLFITYILLLSACTTMPSNRVDSVMLENGRIESRPAEMTDAEWGEYLEYVKTESRKIHAERMGYLVPNACSPLGNGSCVFPDGKVCKTTNITNSRGEFVRVDFRCI